MAAKGEYLLFLDSDDLLAPNCLERRVGKARSEPDHDLWVFPAANFQQLPRDLETLWGTMRPGGNDAVRFAFADAPWHTSSPLWRRESFLALGGFNERITYGDDAELHLRALLRGARVRQHADATPDAFVRRFGVARMTNTLDDAALRARRIRLEEGRELIITMGIAGRLALIWEGQYFVEAEFLLFNLANPGKSIKEVIKDWQAQYSPSPWRRLTVGSYLYVALRTRDRAYWVLRAARKAVMMILPGEYFSSYE